MDNTLGNLASQELNWNNPNEMAARAEQQQAQAQQASQFQQSKQIQMMQMAMTAKQQQLQAQQWQAEQQKYKADETAGWADKMLKAETPEGTDAIAGLASGTGLFAPQQIQAMRLAAIGHQKKLTQEEQDKRDTMLFEHNLSTTPPPGDTQSVDLPPAPFGIPSPNTSMLMSRTPSPIGQVGGQNVYRQPQQMNPLQQSEIEKNQAMAQHYNSPTGSMGGPAGNDAKNALWAKRTIALSKQNPQSVDPQTLEVAKQIDETSMLTPESLDLYADMALRTGQFPTGFGMAKIRTQVMNKASETAKTLGIGAGDVIAAGSEVSANKGALNQLSKTKTMIDAFSNFTDRQLDSLSTTLDNLQNKIQLYDSSLINKPVISWEKNIQGTPEVQAYLQQLTSTRTEVARLVAGLAGSGATLPVQFEKEWEDVISPNASPARLSAFIRQSKIEKLNRTKAFEQERIRLVDTFRKNADPEKVKNFLNSTSQSPDQGGEQITQGAATE